jgi:hypothetical protein
MPRKTIVAAVAAVAVAAAAIVLLTRGDEPSAELQALQDDAMAEYAPPGGELVETDAQSEGKTLGKPHLARYSRLFGLGEAEPERALEDALAAAEAAGWKLEGEPRTGAFGGAVGFGEKTLPTGRARLTVSLITDARVLGDQVPPPALEIQLEHLSS